MKAVRTIIENYPDWGGSKILDLLSQTPDQPIHSNALEHAIEFNISPLEAAAVVYHHRAVPITDFATLKAVDLRLKKLISLKAEYLCREGVPESPYDTEIQALIRYRRDCSKPNGAPKSFPDEDRRAYRRQAAAIRRLFARAEQDGHHEAVAIVKRQLSLGRQAIFKTH